MWGRKKKISLSLIINISAEETQFEENCCDFQLKEQE